MLFSQRAFICDKAGSGFALWQFPQYVLFIAIDSQARWNIFAMPTLLRPAPAFPPIQG